jgi:AcrR family transcriptional regulator
MPRPRSLSHAAIAAAGLAVIDRDGLGALSMRAVAAELGLGVMSLYRYVTGREEMERLLTDLIFATVDPQVPRGASWQRQVTELAGRARVAIAAHPAVIPLLLAHHQTSPSAWRWLEAMLGALTGAGFTGAQRVVAFRCLIAYVLGALLNESYMPLAGQGTATLAALSPAAYPLAAETARQAPRITPDQEFRQGLAILLDGLGARLPSRASDTCAITGGEPRPRP